ncbi:endonuclease Q family protein, partial [Patescibacteria group bacterium]|nr:endonuclease Q family protein [Patescibacteria group bacterium]
MRQIADFHIHSRYSRACSRDLTLANIAKTCLIKGIDIVGTGDFTHPAWFKSIKDELVEIGSSGLYKLQEDDNGVKFILSTEVALIYKQGGRARRIHIVIHAPNVVAVQKLNDFLGKHYNIRSDGRPILGMSVPTLCQLCFSIDPKFLIYPAHIWTPWFSVFGSKSGFDSLEECFGEYTNQIFAYETGLSSDPEMNWRVSALDKLTLLSNSDAHSLQNLAREANVFEFNEEVTYDAIYQIIKGENKKSFLDYTIEFYPEEGMYHWDGHRACGACLSPVETKEKKGLCPVCNRALTIGVDYRVNELANRKVGKQLKGKPSFKKLVGLNKIIAEAVGVKSPQAKKVLVEYDKLISELQAS